MSGKSKKRTTRSKVVLALAIAGATSFVLIVGLALLGQMRIRASLPEMDGEVKVEGLSAQVEISRDSLGVPTIEGQSRHDVARALGFLHAQERFFQMDLMRRNSAGEICELVGAGALDMDRSNRIHRFRARAQEVLETISAEDLAIIEAYTGGVNAGLEALGTKPFEYMLLGTDPKPWRPEDTILVVYAMFLDLYDGEARYERTLGTVRATLAPEMVSFIAPIACEPDAPLQGVAMVTPPIPSPKLPRSGAKAGGSLPEALRKAGGSPPVSKIEPDPVLGSNNWAVSGSVSGHGRAMVADDMHLGIGVPNTWYRAMMKWPDGRGGTRTLIGVTLPGAPAIVAGSNTHLAWGLTNNYGDYTDVVVVEQDPSDASRYLTAGGPKKFRKTIEKIHIKDQEHDTFEIVNTIWGPIIGSDHEGRLLALKFSAHSFEGVNLDIMKLEQVGSVAEALKLAPTFGIPPQNFTCADDQGHIGWTVAGRIPVRVGLSGRFPESWADGSRYWKGFYHPDDAPRVYDPPSGLIWTANSRVMSGADLEKLGDGHYALGSRASQIRDHLMELDKPTEKDLLALQLDDRALFMARWREHVMGLLDDEATAGKPDRAEFKKLVKESWDGHVSIDSVGYRLVRNYRLHVIDMVMSWLTAPCLAADPSFDRGQLRQVEASLWKLFEQEPAHLLHPDFESWKEAQLAAVDASIAQCKTEAGSLAACTWGARNTTQVKHPITHAVEWLGAFLNMKPRALPGDSHVPRFQSPTNGASERFVISPGHEADAIFHMPCGQSGHPMSKHYSDGHRAWEEGEPTPLLPGEPVNVLTLVP